MEAHDGECCSDNSTVSVTVTETSQDHPSVHQDVLPTQHSPVLQGGQGRCTAELEWNAKLWLFCVLVCLAFVFATLITGCKPINEDDAGRRLRKQFNGL